MLNILTINNIALVSRVEMRLGSGLTLLTGETGSGKSILVDALSLVLGSRASADLIRTGEDSATVEAAFDLTPALRNGLLQRGLPSLGDELVVRREINVAGRGRATVNGALVPVATLRELAPLLVTVYGQHEPQGLLDPAGHIEHLDRFGEVDAGRLAGLHASLRTVEGRLEELRRDRRELERRREMLHFQVQEIERAGLAPGEEDELRQERLRCQNASRLAGLSSEAYALLYEDEGAALSRLGQAFRRVEELAAIDPRFEGYLKSRPEVMGVLEDLAYYLRDYSGHLEVSPERLDEIEHRLALIERLKRKYGARVEEVIDFGRQCRSQLEGLGDPEEVEQRLEAERATLASSYFEAARTVSALRRSKARELEQRLEKELRQLAMERTRFRVRVAPEPLPEKPAGTEGWQPNGFDTVEFLLAPNVGEELRPLERVASGGELSRLLLALSCAAPAEDEAASLVFDEVDAGIGGRVADVVGRKLAQLARGRQVLCVTHLPQIAAFADHHYLVRKSVKAGRTLTSVEALDAAGRVEELARMMGGETVGAAAREHATQLLRLARG